MSVVNTKNAFMVSIVALALSLGIGISGVSVQEILTEELNDYYICIADSGKYAGEKMEFDRLSASGHRGYPYADSTKGYKDCGDSVDDVWVRLIDYANEIGVDPYALLEEEPETPTHQRPAGTGASREVCPVGEPCYQVPM